MYKSHTQYTYRIHTNTHITQINTTKNKQNKEQQISSQSYTNREGHITANEYRIEKGKGIKLSLILALEAYKQALETFLRFAVCSYIFQLLSFVLNADGNNVYSIYNSNFNQN
jgi:hypothetical protein